MSPALTATSPPAAPRTMAVPGILESVRCIFVRDLRVAMRRRADTLGALAFFLMVTSLFPLGVGPEPHLLRSMAPGVVWVAALLSSMLSLTRLFTDDHHDGTLEQLLVAACPLGFLVLGKVAAHWVASGLLLTLASPVLALQFGLTPTECVVMVSTLLLGTPVLSLVGAIGAALTVGLRGAGVLLSLLILPLCIPVLVFGAGAIDAPAAGLAVAGHLSVLAALLVLALVAAPPAAAAALRISVE